jgi:hypothetical protein
MLGKGPDFIWGGSERHSSRMLVRDSVGSFSIVEITAGFSNGGQPFDSPW